MLLMFHSYSFRAYAELTCTSMHSLETFTL